MNQSDTEQRIERLKRLAVNCTALTGQILDALRAEGVARWWYELSDPLGVPAYMVRAEIFTPER